MRPRIALWSGIAITVLCASVFASSGTVAQRTPDFGLWDVVHKREVRLSEVVGSRAVLLYVWREVCPFCDDIEGKSFDEVVAENQRTVTALVIVEEGDEFEMEMAAAIYKPASLLLLARSREISSLYGIEHLPALIGIDRRGTIRFRGKYRGPEALKALIRQLGDPG